MSLASCNRCKQGAPHLGDSWCLACSAHEAIAGELRTSWGSPGARLVATDVLTSAVRQIRALRRLSHAGAGIARASGASIGAGGGQASVEKPALEGPESREPPAGEEKTRGPGREVDVKKEEADPGDEESSEYTEAEESEGGEETLGAAPKSKASPVERSPVPRRKSGNVPEPERPPAGHGRDRETSHHRSARRESPRRHRSRSRERGHGHRRRRSREREGDRKHPDSEGEEQPNRAKKKKKRPHHRGGGKHQRHWRADSNPYVQYHYKPPGTFWDQDPALR
jgi:hypothetical protein